METKMTEFAPAPLFQKIDCVRLPVTDLEAALVFYRDRLGLRLVWRTEIAAGLAMPDTDAEIVLYTDGSAQEIDLLVTSADEAAAEFKLAGGTVVVPPFDIQIGRCAVVRDPWGNPLVLLDMSKGKLVTDSEGKILGNTKNTTG
jgi:catechol 2,3-dioxygenase-like lactoylglutathione lyase family enzyme